MGINNFYTTTVYEKGAELCRMIRTLLGPEGFRRGMDLYFERHDGEAATVEDFVRCFEETSGRDLTQFRLWYRQAGTPEIVATGTYDAGAKTYRLDLAQVIPPTPGQRRFCDPTVEAYLERLEAMRTALIDDPNKPGFEAYSRALWEELPSLLLGRFPERRELRDVSSRDEGLVPGSAEHDCAHGLVRAAGIEDANTTETEVDDGSIRKEGFREGREGDARAQARDAPERPVRQKGDEPQAGDRLADVD